MSQAVLIQIADGVAAALNAFDGTLNAERKYLPKFELEELNVRKVVVATRALEMTRGARGVDQFDYKIDVGILKKPSPLTDADLDGLMLTVEQIGDAVRALTLSNPKSRCVMASNMPVYDPQHLHQLGQFSSLWMFTFRLWR